MGKIFKLINNFNMGDLFCQVQKMRDSLSRIDKYQTDKLTGW